MNATRDNANGGRLDGSRRELRRLLIAAGNKRGGSFPRSKTLRILTNYGAVTALAIGASGLVLLRPRWIARALRLIPASVVLRVLASRVLNRM